MALRGDNDQTAVSGIPAIDDADPFRNAAEFDAGEDFMVIMRQDGKLYISGDYNWGKFDYDTVTR